METKNNLELKKVMPQSVGAMLGVRGPYVPYTKVYVHAHSLGYKMGAIVPSYIHRTVTNSTHIAAACLRRGVWELFFPPPLPWPTYSCSTCVSEPKGISSVMDSASRAMLELEYTWRSVFLLKNIKSLSEFSSSCFSVLFYVF